MGKKGPLWWRESDWLLRGSSAANQILLRHSGPILSLDNPRNYKFTFIVCSSFLRKFNRKLNTNWSYVLCHEWDDIQGYYFKRCQLSFFDLLSLLVTLSKPGCYFRICETEDYFQGLLT